MGLKRKPGFLLQSQTSFPPENQLIVGEAIFIIWWQTVFPGFQKRHFPLLSGHYLTLSVATATYSLSTTEAIWALWRQPALRWFLHSNQGNGALFNALLNDVPKRNQISHDTTGRDINTLYKVTRSSLARRTLSIKYLTANRTKALVHGDVGTHALMLFCLRSSIMLIF